MAQIAGITLIIASFAALILSVIFVWTMAPIINYVAFTSIPKIFYFVSTVVLLITGFYLLNEKTNRDHCTTGIDIII